MNYAETILPEFDREMANTRKVLERAPEDSWIGKPIPSPTRSAGTPTTSPRARAGLKGPSRRPRGTSPRPGANPISLRS